MLWPVVSEAFSDLEVRPARTRGLPHPVPEARLRQPAPGLRPPGFERQPARAPAAAVEFDWAGALARQVGTVTHRVLQHVDAAASPVAGRVRAFARGQLRALGVGGADLDAAAQRVETAVDNALSSERGRWLFSPAHSEIRSEFALGCMVGEDIVHAVIDRTFVDDQARRWIVDFKTGSHGGGALDAWLDSEVERYRPQLEAYARAMRATDTRPVMLGLYFPLVDAWREWPFAGA